jgi:hypothetical protein
MGPTPAKVGKVIPAQSVNEKLTLVAGLIPDPLVNQRENSAMDRGSVIVDCENKH